LTGTYYSDSDPTYYDDADEVFAALRERLLAEPDPIAELEARGGRLSSEGDIGWHVRVDGIWWSEIMASGGQLVDLRAAAARLLARVRGAK
jgi:hypothetical protein